MKCKLPMFRGKSLESYVTTGGQPVSLSWNKAPFWDLRPDLYYCLTLTGLLFWGASWLRHYATSRKVAGSSPDEVDFFN
jgi:hypothetical protein